MTVAELIAELQKLPPDLPVAYGTDGPLCAVKRIGKEDGSPFDAFEEEEISRPCVVLW